MVFTRMSVTRYETRMEQDTDHERPVSTEWNILFYVKHINHGILTRIPTKFVPLLLTMFVVDTITVPDRFAQEWLSRKGFRNLVVT